MTTLSFYLYLAGSLGGLKVLFGIFGLLSLVSGVVFLVPGYFSTWQFHNYSEEEIKRIRDNMGWFSPRAIAFGFFLSILSIFLPSKEAIYMIAASELLEISVHSPEANEIYLELKDIVLENIKRETK